MISKAKSPEDYLNSLPEDRKKALQAVRKVILKSLPKGYEETMQYGMISYVVPLKKYPAGYLGKKDVPLPYASLASQKNHMAVYLLNIYMNNKNQKWFEKAYKASGKKMDVGKSCVRFKNLEDLPLDVIGKAVALTSVDELIMAYESARSR